MTLKNVVTTTAGRKKKECPTEKYSNFCRLVFGGFYRFLPPFRKIFPSSERHC